MERSLDVYRDLKPPYERFDASMLGPEFAAELDLVSRLWFRCGHRPWLGAYLNLFLLRDFVATHDANDPPRSLSLASTARGFHRADLFLRDVTDSGREPTGGISSEKVRESLRALPMRDPRVRPPPWAVPYFGFTLLENVEKQCAPLTEDERRLHLSYMSKTVRIMGFPFSDQRGLMEEFARQVEEVQAGFTRNVLRHARRILRAGELIGVPSDADSILPMLPPRTLAVFEPVYPEARPGPACRAWSRLLGRLLLPKAQREPRKAVPAIEAGSGVVVRGR